MNHSKIDHYKNLFFLPYLNNHLLFERRDGGSNGYDREDNFQGLLKYKTGDKKYFYFVQFKKILLDSK